MKSIKQTHCLSDRIQVDVGGDVFRRTSWKLKLLTAFKKKGNSAFVYLHVSAEFIRNAIKSAGLTWMNTQLSAAACGLTILPPQASSHTFYASLVKVTNVPERNFTLS